MRRASGPVLMLRAASNFSMYDKSIILRNQSFQVEGPQNREISLFLRNKIGRFFYVYGSPSALFTFYFGIASQSDVVKPGDDNATLCLTMSACAKLRCRRRLSSFLSKPFICSRAAQKPGFPCSSMWHH